MASTISFVLLAVVASTFIMKGEAITCYTCGLATDRECGDEPTISALTEVTDCKYCTKVKSIDSYGFHTVSRSCITSATEDASGVSEVEMGCKYCKDCGEKTAKCICDGDKCNHGNNLFISITTLLAMLTLVKIFQ